MKNNYNHLSIVSRALICTIVDDWNNYGQRLQAYALCKFVRDNFDVDCRLCDYRTASDEAPSFKRFQDAFIPTVRAKSKADIYGFDPQLILLGSDQVLNHNIIDLRTHCHGILNEFGNVATYAAGEVGWSPSREPVNILTKNDKNKFALQLLNRCNDVSVRDESTVRALSGRISAQNITSSIDPVFLLSSRDWSAIAKRPAGVGESDVFDFAYWICDKPKDARLDEKVKTYTCVGQTKEKSRLSPEEFLWMVQHCRRLHTSSFHGCAFGLIFGKDMALTKKNDSRVANLLKLLNAEGRDWRKINESIEAQRGAALRYLRNAIHSKDSTVFHYIKCSGCMRCVDSCGAGAIRQIYVDGFRYPKIDVDKCAKCGKCVKTCGQVRAKVDNKINKTLLVQSASSKDVSNSSAGGFVKTLSKYVIRKGGVSYGVVFSKDFKSCYFTRADREDMVEFQTRSKYLEPSPPDYKQIKLDVMSGRAVLFAGTPCQVAAVKDAVGTAANLVTVSLVCHAMPSAVEWRKYLTSLEKQHNSYTVYVNQRYGVQELYIVMLNGHVVYKPGQNEWVKKFISDKSVLRPSCLTCEFKYPNIQGDFIIGDSWGIDKKANGIQSGKAGTVFFISERAQDLFNEISPQLKFKQLNTEQVLQTFRKSNPMLTLPKGQV